MPHWNNYHSLGTCTLSALQVLLEPAGVLAGSRLYAVVNAELARDSRCWMSGNTEVAWTYSTASSARKSRVKRMINKPPRGKPVKESIWAEQVEAENFQMSVL